MKLLFILLFATVLNTVVEIPPEDAKKHVGETVRVCGKITDARFFETGGKHTIISIGGNQSQNLSVKIVFDDRKNFAYKPELYLKNKSVCITGKVVNNNGKTEMVISRQEDIKIDDDENSLEIKANDFGIFNKYFDK